MKSYYSIISASIRPEIGENITVGLLVVSDKDIFFSISKSKLSITKQLLPEHLYFGLKNELQGVVETYNTIKERNKASLFNEYPSSFLSESYLSYLSNYKNNIICFSLPKKIDILFNEEIYAQFYKKFIDEDTIEVNTKHVTNQIDTFKRDYLPKLDSYYNINLTVDRQILKKAIIPLKFDLVGKNEIEVFAKSIDLERRQYNVEHDINAFYPIKDLSPRSKKFIISKEPHKKYSSQHLIWENIRTSDWLEYVDISEVERLENYAKEHNVLPLINKEV